MRGRRPTPTRLKILRGNPGKRKLNLDEPKPPAGIPPMHAYLTGYAAEEWARLTADLDEAGILTKIDGAALGCLCVAAANLAWATETLDREGMTVRGSEGSMKRHPACAVQREAMAAVRAFSALFGLSPSDRCRLHVAPPNSERDALSAFLDNPG